MEHATQSTVLRSVADDQVAREPSERHQRTATVRVAQTTPPRLSRATMNIDSVLPDAPERATHWLAASRAIRVSCSKIPSVP